MGLRWKYVLVGMMMTGVPGSTYAVYATPTQAEPEVLSEVVEATPSTQSGTGGQATPEVTATPEPTVVPTKKPVATVSPTASPTPSPIPSPTVTPIPGPTTTPDVWSPAELEPLFIKYANEYGVDKNVLERLANCESHFNPEASYGPYVGMFQFDANTWVKYRQMMGADTNLELRKNVEESIRTAAFVIAQGGIGLWPRCL
jgi:hypothetical protein